MIYHLFEYLNEIGVDFPGAGLMQYLSFRAICCAITSILTALIFGKKIIKKLQKRQIGEEIRDLGLEGQLSKKGTPTMGGIIIILSIIIPTLLFADLTNLNTILLLFTTISLGLLGFMDDYVKVFKHNKEGISGRYKIVGQVGIGFIVAIALLFSPQLGLNQTSDSTNLGLEQETISVAASDNIKTTIPFFKNNEFDYKSLSPFDGTLDEYTTWIVYILMVLLRSL